MGRKRRYNRSVRHEPKRPKPAPVLDTLLAEAKIERKTQAAIMEDLVRKYHGEIPVAKLHELRAIRLQPMRVL